MSLCNIDHILIRIASAHPKHHIAVFRNVGDNYPKDRLYAVFGDTALTQLWIRRGISQLVGLFDLAKHNAIQAVLALIHNLPSPFPSLMEVIQKNPDFFN